MMKKILFTLMLMSATPCLTGAMAQQADNNDEQAELTADSAQADGLDAFSDTTTVTSSSTVSVTTTNSGSNFPFDDDDFSSVETVFHDLDFGALAGMGFVLLILLILFVLAPVLIIGLILYFIYKNRKQRMRLAEMAIKNGQPIPQEIVDTPRKTGDDDLRAKGIRQAALGLGLAFFLGWLVGDVGAGIGILVLCIGLGNLIIARNAKKERDTFDDPGNDVMGR